MAIQIQIKDGINMKKLPLRSRIARRRNIFSKAFITLIFSLSLSYDKVQQMQGYPAQSHYFVVQHAFDSGFIYLIFLLSLFGFYLSFTKHNATKGRLVFLFTGLAIWVFYLCLFLYRDYFMPHPPTMQTVLVAGISVSYLIDIWAGGI